MNHVQLVFDLLGDLDIMTDILDVNRMTFRRGNNDKCLMSEIRSFATSKLFHEQRYSLDAVQEVSGGSEIVCEWWLQ
jgi:hypothetical protein